MQKENEFFFSFSSESNFSKGESYKFYFTSAIRHQPSTFFLHTSDIFQPYFVCKINTFLSIKYAKSEKVTLQRHGKLYTTIYYSGSINHSGTVKKLDSQAQITCHSPLCYLSCSYLTLVLDLCEHIIIFIELSHFFYYFSVFS